MAPDEFGEVILGVLPGVTREQFHVGVAHVCKHIGADPRNPPRNLTSPMMLSGLPRTGSRKQDNIAARRSRNQYVPTTDEHGWTRIRESLSSSVLIRVHPWLKKSSRAATISGDTDRVPGKRVDNDSKIRLLTSAATRLDGHASCKSSR